MFGFFRIKTFEKKQKQSKRPKKILVTLPNFASVALFPMPLNYEHCVIANGTEVYCCGRNSFGQLGTGDCKDRIVIEKIELHIRIICVSAAYHTMAVTEGE
jgi:alpha-tubulin suppressor-like RCC1 family protein